MADHEQTLLEANGCLTLFETDALVQANQESALKLLKSPSDVEDKYATWLAKRAGDPAFARSDDAVHHATLTSIAEEDDQ